MWPHIPEDLAPLSSAQVEALRGEIATAALAVQSNPQSTPEDIQTALSMLQRRAELAAVAAQKRTDERAAADLAAATAALADEPAQEPTEPTEPTETAEPTGSTEAATGATANTPAVTTQMGLTPTAPAAPAVTTHFVSVSGSSRKNSGLR